MADKDRNGNDNKSGERRIVKDSGNTTVYRGRTKERATLSFDYEKGKKNAPSPSKKPENKTDPAPPKKAMPKKPADKEPDFELEGFDFDFDRPEAKTDMKTGTVSEPAPESLSGSLPESAPANDGPSFMDSVKKKISEGQDRLRAARAERAEKKEQEAALSAAIAAEEEKKTSPKNGSKTAQKTAGRTSKKPVRKTDKKIKNTSSVKTKKNPAKIQSKKSASNKKTSSNKKPASKQSAGAQFLSDKLLINLPKSGQSVKKKTGKPKKPKKRRRNRVLGWFLAALKILLAVIIVGGITGGAYAAYTIAHAPKIHPEKIYDTLAVSTHIYDDQGDLISDIYYDENREIAKYDQLPDNLKNAFIAIEDKTFWEHKGFNFRRMFGAIWNSFRGGGEISGTSTITQQLARNIYLPEEKSIRSIKRKIIEMYYAREIEEVLSKEEILTAYLNTIYLGYGCYGVDIAAKKYFSTSVEDLTLEQCAALAALPQAPGVYALLTTEEGEATTEISDGLYANDISQERRYLTLDLMAEQGYITKEEAEAAKVPVIDILKPGKETKSVSSAFKDYLIETVKADLMDQYGLTEDQASKLVYTKGLHIYSTLDSQAQKVVVKEFREKENFPEAIRDNTQVESAMVISEIGTGQIKAMAGTRFADADMLFNRATSPRQPGSSIKPLSVYGPALQRSYEYEKGGKKFQYVKTGYDKQEDTGWGDYITVASFVSDEKMKVNGMNWPQNFSKTYTGYNNFRTAIQQSINTCAIKILAQVGLDYSMEKVKEFGITTVVDDASLPQNDLNLAALGLGAMTYGVTPLEMSLAYATFPNGGVHNSGICYTKVTDSEGKVLLEGKSVETKVLDEGVAWIMTDVLQGVVTRGIAGDAAVPGIMVGGKTGTTDETWDIWFDGFTPSYSGALWIGTDDNTPLDTTSSVAAALWGNIMGQIDRAKEGEYRDMPNNIIIRNGDYFTKGTEPPVIIVKKDKDKNKDKKKDEKTEGNPSEAAPAAPTAPADPAAPAAPTAPAA